MQTDIYSILVIVIAYLIGNISPSIILGKIHGIDIKKEGSGNAGTTNALRVLGKKAALITLVIDIGKGILAVRLGMLCGFMIGGLCAAVISGHASTDLKAEKVLLRRLVRFWRLTGNWHLSCWLLQQQVFCSAKECR